MFIALPLSQYPKFINIPINQLFSQCQTSNIQIIKTYDYKVIASTQNNPILLFKNQTIYCVLAIPISKIYQKMTTSSAKIFHDIAMNLSFEAKMAKTKGDEKTYLEQMKKAFFLEKEAALKLHDNSTIWKNALIRSAAWLAFKCGLLVEALDLVKFGLKGNPPSYLENELFQLEK